MADGHSMSQLRLDPLTGRWIAISVERAERPQEFVTRTLPVEDDPRRPCPFCPGNEDATPPALETYGPEGKWRGRTGPNKSPPFHGAAPPALTRPPPVGVPAPRRGGH